MTVEPGTVLADRYRVVRVIGRGGMGVVVEAVNIVTDKRVAAKWLHPHVASDPEATQRLLREATAACRIRHPNVVDVYDVIRQGESIVLVMELLEGESLRAVLDRGSLSTPALLSLLLPAMQGVAEAHRQGVIHRDVHPGNIFIAAQANGRPPLAKVLDFGISKVQSDDPGLAGLTRSGMTMGTPLYMSYEQLISARDVDARTDVYAFGVVLYEALTGQLPYDGENFAAIAMQIVNGNPVPPRQLRPALPDALERIVLRAMARNREDRIGSLPELIGALTPFAAGSSSAATDLEIGAKLAARPHALQETQPVAREPQLESHGGRRVDTQGRTSSPLAESSPPRPAARAPGARKRALLMGMGVGACVAVVGAAVVLHRKHPAAEAKATPAAVEAATLGAVLPAVNTAALTLPLEASTDAGSDAPPTARAPATGAPSTLAAAASAPPSAGALAAGTSAPHALSPAAGALPAVAPAGGAPHAGAQAAGASAIAPALAGSGSARGRTLLGPRAPGSRTLGAEPAAKPADEGPRFRAGRARREDF